MLGTVLVAPLGLIVLRGVFPRVLDGSFGGAFSRWPEVFTRPDLSEPLVNSLLLAVLTTIGCLIVGTAAGFVLAHADLPARGLLAGLLFLPVLTPPYVGALAWMLVMQPSGFLDQALGVPASGLTSAFLSVWGIAAVMVLHLYPLVLLPAQLAFATAGGRHGLVARLAGASRGQSFRHITLPLALPALIGGGLLVFAATLEEFGVAATLGRQAGFWVMPTEIHRLVTAFPSDAPLAATISLILILFTLGVFALQRVAQRRAGYLLSARATVFVPLRLGPWRAPAAVGLGLIALLAGVVPWAGVALTSLMPALGRGLRLDNLSLDRYAQLLVTPVAQASLVTSLVQATAAASLVTILGLAVAHLNLRTRQPGAKALDGVSLLPAAVPSIVTSLAILTLWNISPVPDAVYRTPFLLAVTYAVLFLPFGVRYATAGLASRPASLEWAARVAGASGAAAWRLILLPAIRPWLVVTWLTVFAISTRELVSSLIVRPAGVTTTAVYVFQRFEQGDPGQGMTMAMITLLLTAAALLVARRVGGSEVAS